MFNTKMDLIDWKRVKILKIILKYQLNAGQFLKNQSLFVHTHPTIDQPYLLCPWFGFGVLGESSKRK